VICEKPYISTYEEAKTLAKEAKKRGLMIFEGILTLNLTAFEVIKRHLPALEPLRMVQLNYSQYSS
jgi:predicted dehydrogenase